MNIDSLRAPAGDGDILIEPPGARWRELIDRNQSAQRRQELELGGMDVGELRARTRRLVGGSGGLETPIIAAGHQPAFVHPGVWAKHVFVHHASGELGAHGLDLVVDNDAPQSWDLVAPVVKDGFVSTNPVSFGDAPVGSPYEARPVPDAAERARIRLELTQMLGDRFTDSMLPAYLDGFCTAGAADFVDAHLAGRGRVDPQFSADLHEVRVSRVFGGAFVADLLLNAGRFATAYNAALAEYRRRQEVRSANRPLPDLGQSGQRIETALWAYRLADGPHPRRRLWVERRSESLVLHAETLEIGSLSPSDLGKDANAALSSLAPWVVRPRALTLTLWARLLACDLFVHGIGGAKYDRITDDIFRRYYRLEPPEYACVTATLRLPLPRFGTTPEARREAERRLRDVHSNPQRYLHEPPTELLNRRRELIDASARLREMRADRLERRRVFLAIRDLNGQVLASHPGVTRQLAADRVHIVHELGSDAASDWREYFYALQPRDRLTELADRLQASLQTARLPRS